MFGPRSRRTIDERVTDDVDRMSHPKSGRGEEHGATRIGRRHHYLASIRRGRSDRLHLARSNDLGEVGMHERVGATGTATQAIVGQLENVGPISQDATGRAVDLLHVPVVAGVLDEETGASAVARSERSMSSASHSTASTTRAENSRASSVPRMLPYSFMAAPQPAESTMIGASPGIELMVSSARRTLES
jgi:hypothetical protein